MNKSKLITSMHALTLAIISLGSLGQTGFAQQATNTNFTTMFESDPKFLLCKNEYPANDVTDLLSPNLEPVQVCDVNIIDVTHETNNTMTLWLRQPGYAGEALDEINKAGFKVEAVIPDNSASSPAAWMYFTKE